MSGALKPNEGPLVSVLVPAWNARATLRETVESALASTYGPIELIIVDDGSTDGTAELADSLAAHRRVRVIHQANRGVSAALNNALAAARGEFIARLDADDLWHPTKLAKQMTLAAADPDAGFIYTFYRYIDEVGRVVWDGPEQRFPPRALRRSVYEILIGTGSSMLMRREAVQRLGGFDEEFRRSEDWLFEIKAAAEHKIACVPEYLVAYRVSPSSLSQDAAADRDSWLELRQTLVQRFPQIPPFVRDWAHARRSLYMAEGFARRGAYREAIRLLSDALVHDAWWSGAYLTTRFGRSIKRALFRAKQPAPGRPFLDYRPDEPMGAKSEVYGTEERFMRAMHERRVRRLTALDEL